MKKRILAALLCGVVGVSAVAALTACGNEAATGNESGETVATLTNAQKFADKANWEGASVVAEKKSAGEDVANEYFTMANYTGVDSQAKALMEVKSGTADIAIIDYVMSIGTLSGESDYKDLAVVEGQEFGQEQYGIALRKDSPVVLESLNSAIQQLANEGKLDEIATKYNLQDLILVKASDEATPEINKEAVQEYVGDGKMTVGITYFEPMNYMDENGELTGFETEFAQAVCEKLGVDIEFQKIDWDSKETELTAKTIDCIWNGLTITEERQQNMDISTAYMENKQVMVVKN